MDGLRSVFYSTEVTLREVNNPINPFKRVLGDVTFILSIRTNETELYHSALA